MESHIDRTVRYYQGFPDYHLYVRYEHADLVIGYSSGGKRRVRKLIAEAPDDDREFRYAPLWYEFLGYDFWVSKHGSITEVDMPWLGSALDTLYEGLQSNQSLMDTQTSFTGFSPTEADMLLHNTFSLLTAFHDTYGLVHSDIYFSNVLYHPELSYFPIIDAEGFETGNTRKWEAFRRRFTELTNFIYSHLVYS